MINFWELEQKMSTGKFAGKPEYQEALVTITGVDPTVVPAGQGTIHNCTLLGRGGISVPGSLFFKAGEPCITDDQLNDPMVCRVKVEYSNGQGSFEGKKYMIMVGPKQAKGYSGGGQQQSFAPGQPKKAWIPPSPEDKIEKEVMMCLSYSKDLVVAKIIPLDALLDNARVMLAIAAEMKVTAKEMQNPPI